MKVKVWNCDYIFGIVYKGQDINYMVIIRLQLKKILVDNILQIRFGYWNLNGCVVGYKFFVVCDSCYMKVVFLICMEILFIWKIYYEFYICIVVVDFCNLEMKVIY